METNKVIFFILNRVLETIILKIILIIIYSKPIVLIIVITDL